MRRVLSSGPVFTRFSIYNPKCVLSINLIPAQLEPIASIGTGSKVKEGAVLFQFIRKEGDRFVLESKQFFRLSVVEAGQFLHSFHHIDSAEIAFKRVAKKEDGLSLNGAVRELRIGGQDEGALITLQVGDKSTPGSSFSSSFEVQASWPELQVLKVVLEYAIPRLLGFHLVLGADPKDASSNL